MTGKWRRQMTSSFMNSAPKKHDKCQTVLNGWGLHTELWCEDLREKRHLKDLDTDGRIILQLIFKK